MKIISRAIRLLREARSNQLQILKHSRESVWANVFHDSIRGKIYLESLPLNVGKWAPSYSFFYLLNRILMDFKPRRILEFGLGESSKLISAYLDNELSETEHTIIEHDRSWAESFSKRFPLSKRSHIQILPLQEVEIEDHKCMVYRDLGKLIGGNFDFYVIDGPFGSKRYSRFDLVEMAKRIRVVDEFVILVDDYNRQGEVDTVHQVKEVLNASRVAHFTREYKGYTNQIVIASTKYRLAASL